MASGQLQDVDRCLRLGKSHHPDLVVRQLTHGERYVGVGLVLAGSHDHRRLLDADIPEGLRIVQVPHRNRNALVMQPQCLVLVTNQQHVWVSILLQLMNECPTDRIKIRNNDMPADILGQSPRSAGRILRFHPWLVGKTDESKRENNEHRKHTEKHHSQ